MEKIDICWCNWLKHIYIDIIFVKKKKKCRTRFVNSRVVFNCIDSLIFSV